MKKIKKNKKKEIDKTKINNSKLFLAFFSIALLLFTLVMFSKLSTEINEKKIISLSSSDDAFKAAYNQIYNKPKDQQTSSNVPSSSSGTSSDVNQAQLAKYWPGWWAKKWPSNWGLTEEQIALARYQNDITSQQQEIEDAYKKTSKIGFDSFKLPLPSGFPGGGGSSSGGIWLVIYAVWVGILVGIIGGSLLKTEKYKDSIYLKIITFGTGKISMLIWAALGGMAASGWLPGYVLKFVFFGFYIASGWACFALSIVNALLIAYFPAYFVYLVAAWNKRKELYKAAKKGWDAARGIRTAQTIGRNT